MKPSTQGKVLVCSVAVLLLVSTPIIWAQVTTANLYGIVTDQTGAVLPGVDVTLTNQGTGNVRSRVANDVGEFVFELLPVGTYTLHIEMPGFKIFVKSGIRLTAGQSIRETYVLEVGEVTETVTVEGGTTLISTASTEQRETLDSIKVRELPLSRRNVTAILALSTGVDVGGGSVRINGMGKSGAVVTVDGTDANSNPSEGRAMAQYGGRNYIDVMSIEAIEEVQLLRGILPAEYGGAISGQVNLISKAGTNSFHGSLFHNYRSHIFNARNPFVVSRREDGSKIDQPREVFNQYGGSVGGPVLTDRAFFFFTFEGYRESQFQRVSMNVPTPKLRSEILSALPFPATRLLLATLPLPSVERDEDIGRFEGVGLRERSEDHFVVRGDYLLADNSNLAVTWTRNRPFGLDPRAYLNGSNDRTYDYAQDRLSFQYVTGNPLWASETRFGYNHQDMSRLDHIFTIQDPDNPENVEWQRRIPRMSIRRIGGWGSGEVWLMDGTTYSLDQKVSRHMGQHLIKFGGRYLLNGGSRTNPENPSYAFNSKEDMFLNLPNTAVFSYGSHGPHDSRQYEFGFFLQDDWRVTPKLMLNLGVRYDFFSNNVVTSDGPVEVVVKNYELPATESDWRMFKFGPRRPFDRPTEHDAGLNLGPRIGFAYNVDGRGKTILRGGFGTLFAAHVPAIYRQSTAHPIVPFRIRWSQSEAEALGVNFPMYAEDTLPIAIRDTEEGGVEFGFSAIDPNLQAPYTMHYQLNVQRQVAGDLMWEVGFVGNRGVKFPMHRRINLPDRITGERPNPTFILGGPYYVDNSESTVYSSLQTSLRKRFSNNLSFDIHYTWGQAFAYTNGDVGVYYGTDAQDNVQDFWNLAIERGNPTFDAKHRLIADWIYQLPFLSDWGNPVLRHTLGGWQISGIFSARTGEPRIVSQSCPHYACRPDYVPGQDPVFDDWKQQELPDSRCTSNLGARCDVQYLNLAAFQEVPESDTGIAIRPGNVSRSFVREPGRWSVALALAKNFRIREGMNLQFRMDMFNAFNHVNLGGLNTNISGNNPGRLDSAGGMRSMQAVVRLGF
ncbi:MAG: TonB-dependent receptor [Acidobacteriota bacterium]